MRASRSSASHAVRIIAGRWRSRRIPVPAGLSIRPTPNRVRETLFNWLQPHIEGARCLDLFAGTGALGIEALSRGAAHVEFVEEDRVAADALRAQLVALGAQAHEYTVTAGAAERYLRSTALRFDIVFLDPPFALDAGPLLTMLWPHVATAGLVYCEQALERGLPALPAGAWIKTGKAGNVCFGLARP
jgi:16S rRNA (guanine966-N2)-methyltransferase